MLSWQPHAGDHAFDPGGRFCIVLCVLLAVGGCGGGGGAVGPDSEELQPSPPPPPSCVRTVLGCLTREKFLEERATIEAGHEGAGDYANQWGLSAVRAGRAWAQLELERGVDAVPGSGRTVGVIDTGIDAGHPLFSRGRVTEHFLSGAADETGDSISHGTAVASVIAAQSPGDAYTGTVTAPRGVAPGADIAMFAVPAEAAAGSYVPLSLAELGGLDDRLGSVFGHVIDSSRDGRTIDFVNMSLSLRGMIDQYGEQDLRTRLDAVIAALAQSGASGKTVFVGAAGNAHGTPCSAADFPDHPGLCVDGRVVARSVEVLSGLPVRIEELRGQVIAVVAVAPDADGDGDHEIAPFSNRCGIAARWCLAAPGAEVRVAYFGPDPVDGTPGARGAYSAGGTSFAAPMVTGGLVVLKHYFRDQLSNTALVERLLATADKGGIYADRDTYGEGLMDLAAATAPVGAPRVVPGERTDGTGVDLARTRLSLGGALGDGLTRSLAGRELAAFDDLGAPFWFSLDSLSGAASGPLLGARLGGYTDPARHPAPAGEPGAGFVSAGLPAQGRAPAKFPAQSRAPAGWWRLGLLEAPAGPERSHLGLAGRALAVAWTDDRAFSATAFTTAGEIVRAPASGASVSWRPDGWPLALHSGWVAERNTLLGSTAEGAFGTLAADAVFAGIRADTESGGWRLSAGAEIGTVEPAARGGLVGDVSTLTTSTFAFRASRPVVGDGRLHLSVTQPLRVEHGRLSLAVPVGRTTTGGIVRERVSADLAPSGRQIDVEARWDRPLAGGELRLGAVVTRDPGHRAGEGPELTLLSGWRRTF